MFGNQLEVAVSPAPLSEREDEDGKEKGGMGVC